MTTSPTRPSDPRTRIKRNHYTATEAYEARECFVLGWSTLRIANRMKIPRVTIHKWCVQGLYHENAIPPGFEAARARYKAIRATSANRIDQVPRAVVRRWREMIMRDPSCIGLIQLEMHETDVTVPLTGFESRCWSSSDLFRLLFGACGGRRRPYPQGRTSIPKGYASWWKGRAREIVNHLATIEAGLSGRAIRTTDMEVLSPILGTLVDDVSDEVRPDALSGFVEELPFVGGFSRLDRLPFIRGLDRRCIRSAVELAHGLMDARGIDKVALSTFVTWGEASTHHPHQARALREDVASIAERCCLSRREAGRVLRLAQEIRFLCSAGHKDLAEAELARVCDHFDRHGVVPVPDTSFSRQELHCRERDFLTGRFCRRGRQVRLRERCCSIKTAA